MSPFLPETWPFALSQLPETAYLVGGSVRDQLLNRRSDYLDLDFVLPDNAVEVAANLAKDCNAGFVVLDEARHIARVVFDTLTVDFAQQQGESLEADLRRRDFTINAIAYHPHSQTLIDPLQGQQDIERKTLRMVSDKNLAADPLRLMRAYRQAAQLGFSIATSTQRAIGQLAPQLQTVSIERIRSELDGLLSVPGSHRQLSFILTHQLLSFCLPHFTAKSIEHIAAIDRALTAFANELPDYGATLANWPKPVPIGVSRSWIKAAKLSCLLSKERAIAAKELTHLTYSRAETQAVCTLIQAEPILNQFCQRPLSRAQQFFLFKVAGDQFPAVSLLAHAKGVTTARLQPLIAHYLDPASPLAHAPKLITGNDLMKKVGITPGPKVGQLLKSVEQAQAEGKLKTTEDAIAWVTTHLT